MEQLEYNTTLTDVTNVQEEVEMICRWAAARAAGIGALPKFNYIGLLANVYTLLGILHCLAI